MSAAPAVLNLGTRVSVTAGTGTVRFVGQTSFAAGKWVGVELDSLNGKNDGSIEGKRYFSTTENRGVFVRPAGIKVLAERDSQSPTTSRPPSKVSSRPLSASGSRPLSASTSRSASSASARAPPLSRTTSTTSRPPAPSSGPSSTDARSPSPPKPSFHPSVSRPPSTAPLSPPSRAESPRKLVPTNFAPPRASPPNVGVTMAGSGLRRNSTVSSTGSRKMLASPPLGGGSGISAMMERGSSSGTGVGSGLGLGLGIGMVRSRSGDSGRNESPMSRQMSGGGESLGGESLMEEELPQQWVDEDGDLTATAVTVVSPTVEAALDPFSLRPTERKVVEATVPKREHDELLAKLRILEVRRAEDREKLRDIDRHKEEAEDWSKIKEKTKAKITELSAELRELKRQNKELAAEREIIETKFADLSDQVEISLLDKEVAEEQLEASQHALEVAKERAAELEIELIVLKEDNARMTGEGEAAVAAAGSGDARSSLAYVQLEKQNGRLKDALIRMRDLTSETEAEHRRHVADLEKELNLTTDLQVLFDNNLVELERAESQIEELKQQLDDALGAEDMLEQLTERNLTLSEKLEEMSEAIEDLEALQEVSNELEENHVETEKQMQEEIDLKDLQLREQQQRASALEESLADYEGTITQFRELVLSLQSDLDNLRQHQASQQTESQSLTSQSQAMLNLNLKLQSSMLKSQVKTIDLELRKLDAQQAIAHLAITKPYLVPSFFESDSASVDALLFFERLAYKADLISMVVEANHSVTDSLNSVVPESLVGICETRAKLGRYAALNRRFAAQIKRCTPAVFLKMGSVHRELLGTEKRIDAFIDALRREDLREVDCGREVEGLIAQEEHLAELYLQEPLLDLAEREHSFIASLDLDFDTIAAAAGFTKQALATITKDPEVLVELGDFDLDTSLYHPLQNLVNQARNSKVTTKKLLRRLGDLLASSSALSFDHAQGFETLAYNSSAIAAAAAKLATDVALYCSDLRTTKHPFQPQAILAIAQEVTESELGKQTTRPFDEMNSLLAQLGQDVATTLASANDVDHVVKLSYEAPWIIRVAELHSEAATNVDAERKVARLNEEMRDLVREMRNKDQAYQESTVKIELMEKRMEAVKAQADAMALLEADVAKLRKEKTVYEDAMETLQNDLDAMEKENFKFKQNTSSADNPGGASTAHGDGESVSYEGNSESWRLIEQIESLRGAVRFLRSENSFLKSQDLLSQLEDLPTYTVPTPPPIVEPGGMPSRTRRAVPQDPVVRQQAFATESRLLLQEARTLSATPRLVDLSILSRGRGWQPGARAPENQFRAEKERARELGRKVEKLWALRPASVMV